LNRAAFSQRFCFVMAFRLGVAALTRMPVEVDMTHKDAGERAREEKGRALDVSRESEGGFHCGEFMLEETALALEDAVLDVSRESEGGFPCGEFLLDLLDEEEEAALTKPAATGGETKTAV